MITSKGGKILHGEAGQWRRFLRTLLLVLWPTLIIAASVERVAWRTGETVDPDTIARWQSQKPGRMWRGGDGRSYLTYKVARIKLLKPEVVMLGQSRANSFAANDVRPYPFYNAGLTAWTFNQYLRFLELINSDGYEPRVLFFNLDYWMFSRNFDQYWSTRFYEHPPTHAESVRFVLQEWQKNPIYLLRRLSAASDLQGIYALLNGDGFKEDGSLTFSGGLSADPKRLDNDGIVVGQVPVQVGNGFDEGEVASFERFVAYAHSKNIVLIGIQVPFYKKVLDGLNSSPNAGIWREFRSEARRRYFASKGVMFFDFADMPEYRDKAQHFIDSIHPDPKVFHDMLRRILADPQVKAVLPKAELD
jgi:hypothetical protein